jgi:hypothetical protein
LLAERNGAARDERGALAGQPFTPIHAARGGVDDRRQRSLCRLLSAAERSWSIETGSHWRRDNPASGQCGVTALVVHDRYGGEILKTDVNGAWHFHNLIDGTRVDFTMSQFDSPISYDDVPSSRDEAFGDCSRQQCELLLGRVTSMILHHESR